MLASHASGRQDRQRAGDPMFRDELHSGAAPGLRDRRFELLVGAPMFWERARRDIANARERVLVQAMTFEGDAVGAKLVEVLLGCPARERSLLVDAYSLHVVNDTLLPYLPWRPRTLRDEARAARALLTRLAEGGVRVGVTNPVGRNPLRFPLRNHKKLLVADGVA